MGLAFNPLRQLFIRQSGAGAAAEVPDGYRYYVIGDIHGRADLLARLFGQIQEDARSAPAGTTCVVVCLGDYVDRGADSRGVLDLLINCPLVGFEKVLLKGNHEDAMLHFLDEPSTGGSWFAIGGQATAMSYGVRVPNHLAPHERFDHVWLELRLRVPLEHRELLANLQLTHVAGDYLFVHAGVRPGIPLHRQDPRDLMWIRGTFLRSRDDHGKVVVHGHAAGSDPDVQSNRIGIDTTAYATNVLTCLVLEGAERRFIDTSLANGRDCRQAR